MAPKRKKKLSKSKENFAAVIPLPKIKSAEKYFQDFGKQLKCNGGTLSAQNSFLFITAENEKILANIRTIFEVEMNNFIGNKRSLTKISLKTKNIRTNKDRGKQKRLISNNIISRRIRVRDCQHSKHVNLVLRAERQKWNRTIMTWKQWYINRRKFNAKFKAISKYFGKEIRRRHHGVSFDKQKKRSEFEYYHQKILGRKRDLLKAKRAQRAERSIKPRKIRKTLKCNPILGEHGETTSKISKLTFITADAAETMRFHLKTTNESHLAMISRGRLEGNYDFSLFPWVDTILTDSRNFVIRYYNQRIFIYTTSFGMNRPLKQNLVYTFSTLNGNGI